MKIALLLVLFFSAVLVAPAQDRPSHEVLVPLPVATFFLEQNEKARLLQVQVDTLHKDVELLEKLDSTRQLQLVAEKQKQVYYDSLITLYSGETEACRKSEIRLSRELKRQKFLTKVAGYGTVGIVIILYAIFD